MSLAAGTRLGPYVLQSLLGAGGMGEVYRAQDSRLLFRHYLGDDRRLPALIERMKRDVDARPERARQRGLLDLAPLLQPPQ